MVRGFLAPQPRASNRHNVHARAAAGSPGAFRAPRCEMDGEARRATDDADRSRACDLRSLLCLAPIA